jgi:hypothetical protein
MFGNLVLLTSRARAFRSSKKMAACQLKPLAFDSPAYFQSARAIARAPCPSPPSQLIGDQNQPIIFKTWDGERLRYEDSLCASPASGGRN